MLLSEYAIKWWLVIPPLLASVSAPPGETWTPKFGLKTDNQINKQLDTQTDNQRET